eukprot:scpid86396/ scgid23595/ 
MSGAVLKEGFLVKSPPLESRLSQWRKRYFRLRESGHLDYYSNEKKEVKDKIDGINLGNCTAVELLSEYEGKDFCIRVSTADRVYVFKCGSDDEVQDWYRHIKAARDAACGIQPVSVDGGDLGASARPLPTLPRNDPAAAAAAPANRSLSPSASFDETKRPKNKRVDTTKGRVSYPEITPLSNHHSAGYPVGSASGTAGAAGGLPPSHGPGDARGSISASGGRPPNRKDGYTKIDFSGKQPKPPPAAAAAAGQKPAQQRISYTPVEIRGKTSESNTVQSVAAPATANRINYTQVDLSAKSRPKSNTASAGGAKNAASRVSYHQVDLSKTENYQRPSAEAAMSASVPPVRAFGEDEHSVHPSSSSAPTEEYEQMDPAAVIPPSALANQDEYEHMGSVEPPTLPQPGRPKPAPRHSLRSANRDLPGLPQPGNGGLPVLPPRPR